MWFPLLLALAGTQFACRPVLDAYAVACRLRYTAVTYACREQPSLYGCSFRSDCYNPLFANPCSADRKCIDPTAAVDDNFFCPCDGGFVGFQPRTIEKNVFPCTVNPCASDPCSANKLCLIEFKAPNLTPTRRCISIVPVACRPEANAESWPLWAPPQPLADGWFEVDPASCNECTCHRGVVTCTRKICTPPPPVYPCTSNEDCAGIVLRRNYCSKGKSDPRGYCSPFPYDCSIPYDPDDQPSKYEYCCPEGCETELVGCAGKCKAGTECVGGACQPSLACAAVTRTCLAAQLSESEVAAACTWDPTIPGCALCRRWRDTETAAADVEVLGRRKLVYPSPPPTAAPLTTAPSTPVPVSAAPIISPGLMDPKQDLATLEPNSVCIITESPGGVHRSEPPTSKTDECAGFHGTGGCDKGSPCAVHVNRSCVSRSRFCTEECEMGCDFSFETNEVACAYLDRWADCPAVRQCFTPESAQFQGRHCCADGEVCDVFWYKGGRHGIYGGMCVPGPINVCQSVPCSANRLDSTVIACALDPTSGAHACVSPEALEVELTCPPGYAVVPSVNSSVRPAYCAVRAIADPCLNSFCERGEVCVLSLNGGAVTASCQPHNTTSSCNELRILASLPPCSGKCLPPPSDGDLPTCESSSSQAALGWPPHGVVPCSSDFECPEGEYCTGDLPILTAVLSANGKLGSEASTYLYNGPRVCQPDRFTCNLDRKTLWNNEERRFCCGRKEVGCDGYNCMVGDPNSFSLAKRTFCCQEFDLGCQENNDCLAGEQKRWSFDKRTKCCENQGIACPAPLHDCDKLPAYGKQEAREYCCQTVGKGCLKAFPCDAEVLPWSEAERQWCCRNRLLGCPVDSRDLYDCQGETTVWGDSSQEEILWCCLHKGVRCDAGMGYTCTKSDSVMLNSAAKAWCCDHRGVFCQAEITAQMCIKPYKRADPVVARKCCAQHEIGCPIACWLPGSFLSAEQKASCCTIHGVHCANFIRAAPVPGGVEYILYFSADYRTLANNPKRAATMYRAALASVHPALAANLSLISLLSFALVPRSGAGTAGRIDVHKAWQEEQLAAWPQSLASVYAATEAAAAVGNNAPLMNASSEASLLSVPVHNSRTDVVALSVSLPDEYAEHLETSMGLACGGAGPLSTTKGGTAFAVRARRVHGRACRVASISPVEVEPVEPMEPMEPEREGWWSAGNWRLLLVVLVPCSTAIACSCTVYWALQKEKVNEAIAAFLQPLRSSEDSGRRRQQPPTSGDELQENEIAMEYRQDVYEDAPVSLLHEERSPTVSSVPDPQSDQSCLRLLPANVPCPLLPVVPVIPAVPVSAVPPSVEAIEAETVFTVRESATSTPINLFWELRNSFREGEGGFSPRPVGTPTPALNQNHLQQLQMDLAFATFPHVPRLHHVQSGG